jgi:hypothetical protein
MRVTVAAEGGEPELWPTGGIVHWSDFESGDASDWDAQGSEPAAGGTAAEDPRP